MRKDLKILIVIFAIAIPYFWLKFRPRPDFRTTFSKMPKEGQAKFDKATEPMRKLNLLHYHIDSFIQIGKYQEANLLIDSMLSSNPDEYLFVDYKDKLPSIKAT